MLMKYYFMYLICLMGVFKLEARHINSSKLGNLPDNGIGENINLIMDNNLNSYKRRYVEYFKIK